MKVVQKVLKTVEKKVASMAEMSVVLTASSRVDLWVASMDVTWAALTVASMDETMVDP